ncbi:MAG: CBS domain-containing protein [Candidatus Heimdallarchaeota archaeon]|nr:MAG: CBS domain-containing protein [Candidatus Heimdallarchaeota archaeon]
MEYGDSILNLFRKDRCERLIRKQLNVLPETATIRDAIISMLEKEIDYVCILDDQGRFKGILTEQCIVRWVSNSTLDEEAPVASIMTTELECCMERNEPISKLVMTMSKNNFMHMPITDHGKVKGVVSVRDFVSYLVDYFAESIYTLIPDQPDQKKREGA